MNKLINNYNRGFALRSDDLRFVDASVRQAFADVAAAVSGNTPCILWGATVTVNSGNWAVAEGAIFYGGEIWHVAAHSFAVDVPMTGIPNWVFKTYYDAAGVKPDIDNVSHNTYQVREAVGHHIGAAPANEGIVSFADLPRLESVFKKSKVGTINAVMGGAQAVDGVTSGVVSVYAISSLYGSVKQAISVSGVDSFSIEVGFRPVEAIVGYCNGLKTSNNANELLRYEISVAGVVKFYSNSATAVDYIVNLGGIAPFVSSKSS